jgi:hypothetical protein
MNVPPFESIHELNNELEPLELDPQHKIHYLPGYPRVPLDDASKLNLFLHHEYDLGDLAKMAPWLWIMSLHSSTNISPLHRQIVKGRTIIITEDARLHLIWYYDRIYLKPLPKYLLSHKFWSAYLLSSASPLGADRELVRRNALGYLRSYFFLIRYESDFRIATDERLRLVPAGISWEQFCNFSNAFDSIQDSEVSERYTYGEIRLSRLNFYIKFLLRKEYFQRIDAQYGAYFARFYGPIIFAFGVLAILLSAMQLEMAVEQVNPKNQWISFWLVCRWFSIVCLIVVLALSSWLALLFLFMFAKEWAYAIPNHWRKRKCLH